MLFSATDAVTAKVNNEAENQVVKEEVIVSTFAKQNKPEQISKKQKFVNREVESYFSDIPELSAVAYCESRYRHVDQDGNLFRGIVNNKDVGVMQINEYYHLEKAKELGFDIYTLKGNMAYARHIYEEQGLQPWMSSSPCWGSRISSRPPSSELALAR